MDFGNSLSFLTFEKQLARYQEEDSVYKHLYATWQMAKDDLGNILRNVVILFPHYSRHDASHAETIVHRIEAVLGQERIAKLHPTEIWLFLMSAYTHDLGMLVKDEDTRKIWVSEEFSDYLHSLMSNNSNSDLKQEVQVISDCTTNKEMPADWPIQVKRAVVFLLADYIRKFHPDRSRDIINNKSNSNPFFRFDFSFQNFIPNRLIHLLSEIDAIHGHDFETILDLDYCCQGIGLGDDLVYPRRVAAMLRLGDLLDMDNNRFDRNAYGINGIVPQSTVFHQEKEAALRHFLVSENCIEATFDCPDEGSYEAASSWMTWLSNEVTNLSLNWNDIVSRNFGTAPVLKKSSITLNGKILRGNALKRFNFSNDDLFELMEGANIYQNQFSCLRELIQNAEDATKLRLWEDIQSGEVSLDNFGKNLSELTPFDIPANVFDKYKIRVCFSYSSNNDMKNGKTTYHVSVRDRGTGITDERLQQMEQVASSWHNKRDVRNKYKKMPAWLLPTGTFGLGLQSVFRLTDFLKCETAPRREPAKQIIFRSKNKGGRITSSLLTDKEIYPEGSTFSFSFSGDAFHHFSYKFGGVFEGALENADPFSGPNDTPDSLNLYYLVECVMNDVGRGYFPVEITVQFGNANEKQTISLPRQQLISECDFSKSDNFSIYYDLKENRVLAYEKNHCIFYNLTFKSMGKSSYHLPGSRLDFEFRGMKVKANIGEVLGKPYDTMIDGRVSLDGFDTKTWLTLNREEIRSEQFGKLRDILNEDLPAILQEVYHTILTNKEGCKTYLNPDAAISLMVLTEWLCNKNNERKFDKDQVRNVLSESLKQMGPGVRVQNNTQLISDSRTWKDLFDLIWRKHDVYVYSLGEEFGGSNDAEQQKIALIDIFRRNITGKPNDSSNSDLILLPAWAFYGLFDDEELRLAAIYGNTHGVRLYHYSSNVKINDVAFIDEYICKEINSQLLTHSRMLTCAMPKYKSLAIKRFPSILQASYSRVHFPNHYECRPVMITPFNSSDIKSIKSKIPNAEELWEKINQRPDFLTLVKYVHDKNISSNVDDSEIQKDYHLWIQDIVSAYKAK